MKTVSQLIKEKLKEIKKQPKTTGYLIITVDTQLEDDSYYINKATITIDLLNQVEIDTIYSSGCFNAFKDYNHQLMVIDYEMEQV